MANGISKMGGRLVPLLTALAGVVWTVLNGSGIGNELCITEGCAISKLVSFWGVSLWWFGAGAFGLLALTALAGRKVMGFWLAGLFVLIDAFFLGWLALTAPCITCL